MVIKPAQSGVFLAEMNSPALQGGRGANDKLLSYLISVP